MWFGLFWRMDLHACLFEEIRTHLGLSPQRLRENTEVLTKGRWQDMKIILLVH